MLTLASTASNPATKVIGATIALLMSICIIIDIVTEIIEITKKKNQ